MSAFAGSKSYDVDIALLSVLRTDEANACAWVVDYLSEVLKIEQTRSDLMLVLYQYQKLVQAGTIQPFAGMTDSGAKAATTALAKASGIQEDLAYNIMFALYSGAIQSKAGCQTVLAGKAINFASILNSEGPVKAVVSEVKQAAEDTLQALGIPNVLSDIVLILIVVAVLAGGIYYCSHKRK